MKKLAGGYQEGRGIFLLTACWLDCCNGVLSTVGKAVKHGGKVAAKVGPVFWTLGAGMNFEAANCILVRFLSAEAFESSHHQAGKEFGGIVCLR